MELENSERVTQYTAELIKKYCSLNCIKNDVKPKYKGDHPVDMFLHTRSGKIINYEVKRDGRSRETANVFFELKALSEAHACGAERLLMWVDRTETYLDVDLAELLSWLPTQQRYYVTNAGDAVTHEHKKKNPGWAIPVGPLFDKNSKLSRRPDGKGSDFCKDFGKQFWNNGDSIYNYMSMKIDR